VAFYQLRSRVIVGFARRLEILGALKVRKGSLGSRSKVAVDFSAAVAQVVETALNSLHHRNRVQMSQE